ncbi:hypothetical protein GCM10023317_06380 [Actinopolymorpha pittospori]
MKRLVQVQRDIPWLPQAKGRTYIADELPPLERCATAFGLAFEGNRLLLTRLRDRDWNLTGGCIDPGETPEHAAVREVREEASAKVEVIELIGYQELQKFFPKPPDYRWPHPIDCQVYFRCRLIELSPFEPNPKASTARSSNPAKRDVCLRWRDSRRSTKRAYGALRPGNQGQRG